MPLLTLLAWRCGVVPRLTLPCDSYTKILGSGWSVEVR